MHRFSKYLPFKSNRRALFIICVSDWMTALIFCLFLFTNFVFIIKFVNSISFFLISVAFRVVVISNFILHVYYLNHCQQLRLAIYKFNLILLVILNHCSNCISRSCILNIYMKHCHLFSTFD